MVWCSSNVGAAGSSVYSPPCRTSAAFQNGHHCMEGSSAAHLNQQVSFRQKKPWRLPQKDFHIDRYEKENIAKQHASLTKLFRFPRMCVKVDAFIDYFSEP